MRIFANSLALPLSPSFSLYLWHSRQCLINIKSMVAGPGVSHPLVLFILMSRYSCHCFTTKRYATVLPHLPCCNLCHFCFGARCQLTQIPATLSIQRISLFRYDNLWPKGGWEEKTTRNKLKAENGTQRSEQSSTLSMQLLLSLKI